MIAPAIGFGILTFVVINANIAAQKLAFVWFGIGLVFLITLLLTGRKAALPIDDTPEVA